MKICDGRKADNRWWVVVLMAGVEGRPCALAAEVGDAVGLRRSI
jgi:hypothetical protein